MLNKSTGSMLLQFIKPWLCVGLYVYFIGEFVDIFEFHCRIKCVFETISWNIDVISLPFITVMFDTGVPKKRNQSKSGHAECLLPAQHGHSILCWVVFKKTPFPNFRRHQSSDAQERSDNSGFRVGKEVCLADRASKGSWGF